MIRVAPIDRMIKIRDPYWEDMIKTRDHYFTSIIRLHQNDAWLRQAITDQRSGCDGGWHD